MKPSEAMRRGAQLMPQGRGDYFTRDNQGRVCGCATGLALVGAGRVSPETVVVWEDGGVGSPEYYNLLQDTFPALTTIHPSRFCPVCTMPHYIDGNFVIHLNDDHAWSVEQIATYLESVGL